MCHHHTVQCRDCASFVSVTLIKNAPPQITLGEERASLVGQFQVTVHHFRDVKGKHSSMCITSCPQSGAGRSVCLCVCLPQLNVFTLTQFCSPCLGDSAAHGGLGLLPLPSVNCQARPQAILIQTTRHGRQSRLFSGHVRLWRFDGDSPAGRRHSLEHVTQPFLCPVLCGVRSCLCLSV